MATRLTYTKSGLKLSFDVSDQAMPRIQQVYPLPDIASQGTQILAAALVTIAQSGRSGIRVTSLANFLGTPSAVFSIFHVATQGAINATQEVPLVGRSCDWLLEAPLPAALHTFALKRVDAGQITLWPAVSIVTPSDSVIEIPGQIQAVADGAAAGASAARVGAVADVNTSVAAVVSGATSAATAVALVQSVATAAAGVAAAAAPSASPSLSGTVTLGSYSKRIAWRKAGIADNVATAIFTVATTNEGGSGNGGAYSCKFRVLLGHATVSGSSQGAAVYGEYVFSRVMVGGGTGSNSGVETIKQTASIATTSTIRDIGTVIVTVAETSEFLSTVSVQVDLTGTSVSTTDAVVEAEMLYDPFTHPPVITPV